MGKVKSAILSVKNLDIVYDTKKVLEAISFEVNQGEIFGLIGLNGIGKTSIIKTVLDLKPVQKGNIFILGHSHNDIQVKSKIAYLPENFIPPWFLTGREFLHFSLHMQDCDVSDEALNEAAEFVALDPAYLEKRTQTYSKGMRQKLGLIATVLTKVQLVILDEPMSGLDPKAREAVKAFLLKYKAKDQTIIMSSHILADMDEICDRIGIIHDKRMAYLDTPKAIKNKFKTPILEKAFLKLID